ncbi:MAG: hypothetical protein M3342_24040 [Bacteroidota bacterium]|nr:hypothetical protein [Bacteroidota bacterium]
MNTNVISLEKCRALMSEHEITYSDEELLTLRAFLYRLLDITISHYHRRKEKEAIIINLHQNNSDHEAKSLPLHPGEHRRARCVQNLSDADAA